VFSKNRPFKIMISMSSVCELCPCISALKPRVGGQGNVLCQGCPHHRRQRWIIKHQIIKSTHVSNTNLSAGLVLSLLILASSFQNAKTLCTLVAHGSNHRCSLMRLFYSPAWSEHKTSCHAKVMPRNKDNLFRKPAC